MRIPILSKLFGEPKRPQLEGWEGIKAAHPDQHKKPWWNYIHVLEYYDTKILKMELKVLDEIKDQKGVIDKARGWHAEKELRPLISYLRNLARAQGARLNAAKKLEGKVGSDKDVPNPIRNAIRDMVDFVRVEFKLFSRNYIHALREFKEDMTADDVYKHTKDGEEHIEELEEFMNRAAHGEKLIYNKLKYIETAAIQKMA